MIGPAKILPNEIALSKEPANIPAQDTPAEVFMSRRLQDLYAKALEEKLEKERKAKEALLMVPLGQPIQMPMSREPQDSTP